MVPAIAGRVPTSTRGVEAGAENFGHSIFVRAVVSRTPIDSGVFGLDKLGELGGDFGECRPVEFVPRTAVPFTAGKEVTGGGILRDVEDFFLHVFHY